MISKSRSQLCIILAFAGALTLLATIALGAATMRPTEAAWQDTVHGESRFGFKNPYAGENFARSISSYGTAQPVSSLPNVGVLPGHALSVKSNSAKPASNSPGVFRQTTAGVVHATATSDACARSIREVAKECNPNPGVAAPDADAPTSYATSRLTAFEIASAGLPRLTFGNDKSPRYAPITATAACRPGADGTATLQSGGPLMLGNDTSIFRDNRSELAIPTDANPVTTAKWDVIGPMYRFDAVLSLHTEFSDGYALMQLRLQVIGTGKVTGAEGWSGHFILAHAECGASVKETAAPNLPTRNNWPLTQRRIGLRAAPAALQPITDMAEDELAQDGVADDAEANEDETGKDANSDPVHDEAELPSLPDVNELADEAADAEATTPATSMTSAPATSAHEDQTTNTTEPSAPETSTTVPSASTPATSAPATTVPAVPESAEPTTPTSAVDAPQQPQDVKVGRSFTVTGADGAELGTAKVEDIARTPGCGVELTLSITTSDEAGPGRWASIGPDDFAEVRPGGTTRDAQRISSDCEQSANSRTTALSPSNSYEIVIAFQLSDSASRAMLRPEGTAGWTFDLPAPTLPTMSQTTTTPSPATTTVASAPETTVQTSET